MNDVVVISFSLAVVVLFISIVIFVRLYRQEKITKQRLEKKLHAMDVLAKNARIQHEALVNQFKELRAGSIGMSHKLAELVNRFDYLMDRQNQVEMLDQDGRLYSRATKMVELGADINELMRECDLPKAEAELLYSLKVRSYSRTRNF